MIMIGRAMSAELFGLRRRPAVSVLGGVWSVQVLCFAYLISFVAYQASLDSQPAEQSASYLRALLPGGFASFIVNSLPLYGGPVLLILGAIVASTDYRFGTLRTLLPRFTDRTSLLVGRWLAIVLVTFAFSTLTLVLTAAASTVVALAQSEQFDWPGPAAVLGGFGSIWLIMTAFASLGFALGLVTKSLAVAIGIGLLWTPGVENLLSLLAGSVSFLEPVRIALLSPAAGSLAASLGEATGISAAGTPGVSLVAAAPIACLVLAAYILVPLLISMAVFRRRDVL